MDHNKENLPPGRSTGIHVSMTNPFDSNEIGDAPQINVTKTPVPARRRYMRASGPAPRKLLSLRCQDILARQGQSQSTAAKVFASDSSETSDDSSDSEDDHEIMIPEDLTEDTSGDFSIEAFDPAAACECTCRKQQKATKCTQTDIDVMEDRVEEKMDES